LRYNKGERNKKKRDKRGKKNVRGNARIENALEKCMNLNPENGKIFKKNHSKLSKKSTSSALTQWVRIENCPMTKRGLL
jgi:hypothetical protein